MIQPIIPKPATDDFGIPPEHVIQMKTGRLIPIKLYGNVCTFSKAGLHDHIHNLAHVRKT